MTNSVKPVPEGFHTATPSLVVTTPRRPSTSTRKHSAPRNSCECRVRTEKSSTLKSKSAIRSYSCRMKSPAWAASRRKLLGAYTGGIYLYVPDVDEVFAQGGCRRRQIRHGGDTTCSGETAMAHFVDPFGHAWTVSTQRGRPDRSRRWKTGAGVLRLDGRAEEVGLKRKRLTAKGTKQTAKVAKKISCDLCGFSLRPLRLSFSRDQADFSGAGDFPKRISITSKPAPMTIALSATLKAGH